jgi:Alginate lyase
MRLLATLLFISMAFVVADSARAQGPPPAVLLLDETALAQAQAAARAGGPALQSALADLRQQADRALSRDPFSVTDKSVPPPSGDIHDYVSLSIYWWPDSTTSTGLPYIQRDGVRNPEADDATRYDANPVSRMVGDVETLALAYFLTGDERYADHATALLRTWFLNPETRMSPNFRYAQIIPGRDAIRGTGIIESRRFTRVVDSIALLYGCACFTNNDRQGLRQWFADFETWLRTSPNGQMESRTTNNHAVWYDVQLADFALFAGDLEAVRQITTAAQDARIAAQIAPDGSMPRELERTRSLHYSNFNLQAFAELATLSAQAGVDLWTYQPPPTGAGIRSAADFLVPYMTSSQVWPYDEITDVDAFQENAQTLRRLANAFPDGPYQSVLDRLIASQSNPSPLTLLRLNLGFWPE